MKTAFMLSGQGSQIPGMMKDLNDNYVESRQAFQTADQVLGRQISDLCFNGSDEDLALTHNTQPCVLAADLAAANALIAEGIKPDVLAGFSLGEYGALVLSGVLKISDAFQLIQFRADAMQEAVPPGKGAMAALLGIADDEAALICEEVADYVAPANYNSPVQTVVSGTAEGVDKVLAIAEKRGIKGIKLAVSAPFHCDLMKPAAERLKEKLREVTFGQPEVPVYMNVTGQVLRSETMIGELLYQQAMSAVLWKQTLCHMAEAGIDTFIECGPGKTLWGLARKTLPKGYRILRVSDMASLKKTLAELNSVGA